MKFVISYLLVPIAILAIILIVIEMQPVDMVAGLRIPMF